MKRIAGEELCLLLSQICFRGGIAHATVLNFLPYFRVPHLRHPGLEGYPRWLMNGFHCQLQISI
jgi:hypothetical protein